MPGDDRSQAAAANAMRLSLALVIAVVAGCVSSPGGDSPVAAAPVRVIEAAPVPPSPANQPVDATPVAVLGSPPVESAVDWATPTPKCPATVESISADVPDERRLWGDHVLVVAKSERRLWLFEAGALEGCWTIGLGFDPVGDKLQEGDGRTPEGWYRTSDKPWSIFEGAIAIHYPNRDDADRALKRGAIGRKTRARIVEALRRGKTPPQQTAMGGEVLIHGGGSTSDWTLGCVALTDDDLAQLRAKLPAAKRTDLLILP